MFFTSGLILIFIECHSRCVGCITYHTEVPYGLDRDSRNTELVKKIDTVVCHESKSMMLGVSGIDDQGNLNVHVS